MAKLSGIKTQAVDEGATLDGVKTQGFDKGAKLEGVKIQSFDGAGRGTVTPRQMRQGGEDIDKNAERVAQPRNVEGIRVVRHLDGKA